MSSHQHKYSKSIYDMELNEELSEKDCHGNDAIHIVRVPGGWIYYHPYIGSRVGTFVPYSTEFNTNSDWKLHLDELNELDEKRFGKEEDYYPKGEVKFKPVP